MRLKLLLVSICLFVGCGKQETVLPTTPLTDEQKAAIKADDARVAEEESQGSINKKPGAKKK